MKSQIENLIKTSATFQQESVYHTTDKALAQKAASANFLVRAGNLRGFSAYIFLDEEHDGKAI